MAGDGQTDEGLGGQADRGLAESGPRGPVCRDGGGEDAASADETHPVRSRHYGSVVESGAGTTGGGTSLEDNAVGRRQRDKDIPGTGIESLPEHDAGLGPGVGVGLADHAGRNRAVSSLGLVDELK